MGKKASGKFLKNTKRVLGVVLLVFLSSCSSNFPERPAIQYLFSDQEITQISAKEDGWSKIHEVKYNFGYFRKFVWVKFTVVNVEQTKQNLFLELESPWVDSVEVHVFQEKVQKSFSFLGSKAFSEKDFFHRHPVFRLEIPAESNQKIYIKIRNSGILSAPVRIWTEVSFLERIQYDYFVNGIYFGIMLGLLIYNIFIYVNVREKSYLFYCLYLFTLIFNYSLLGGFLKQFIVDTAEFSVKPLLYVSVNSSLLFVSLFSYFFLDLKQKNKFLTRLLEITICFFLILSILSFYLPHNWIEISFIYTFPYSVILLLISGFLGYRSNHTSSRFFIVAWIVLFIGVIFDSLTKASVIPSTTFGRYGVQIGTAFEVVLFSLALGRRIKKLAEVNSKTQNQLSAIKKDLEIAKRIQLRILPSTLPPDKHMTVEVTYLPLYEVGGDFYDFLDFTPHDFGMVIADVTGHGVSAALDSSTVKIAFRNAREFKTSPKDLIGSMNRFVCESLNYRFVSAAYFYFNFNEMTVTFSSAGNPPLILIRDQKIFSFECNGLLLGVKNDFEYDEKVVELKKKDRLLIFTDGLYENLHFDKIPTDVLMGELLNLLNLSQREFHSKLISRLSLLRPEVKDDITLLTLDLV